MHLLDRSVRWVGLGGSSSSTEKMLEELAGKVASWRTLILNYVNFTQIVSLRLAAAVVRRV